MTDEQAASLTSAVSRCILEMRQAGRTLSAPFVAERVLETMPHRALFTDVEETAAYIGTAQVARESLRRLHDREYNPKEIAQQSLDLPEAQLLNDCYSVYREREPVYVPREEMTRADMEYVCAKFDALSEHFARHSRALRADWTRRNAAAA